MTFVYRDINVALQFFSLVGASGLLATKPALSAGRRESLILEARLFARKACPELVDGTARSRRPSVLREIDMRNVIY
jgi:hypothetical protein